MSYAVSLQIEDSQQYLKKFWSFTLYYNKILFDIKFQKYLNRSPKKCRFCFVDNLAVKQSAAYHSPHRFSDIHVPPRSGGRLQITPPRSQVNWVTSISVSIVSLLSLSSCKNGAAARLPTKGINGGSKRRSGTRVPPCRRFDMSGSEIGAARRAWKKRQRECRGSRRNRRKQRSRSSGEDEEEGQVRDGSDGGAGRTRRRKYRAMEVASNEISKYQPG